MLATFYEDENAAPEISFLMVYTLDPLSNLSYLRIPI